MPNEITIKIKADTSEFEAALDRLSERLGRIGQLLEGVQNARQAAYDMEDALDRVNGLLGDRRRLVSRLKDEVIALGEDQ